MSAKPNGPLAGLKVLEFSSIGPGPHCAMLLADLGAEVLRIERDGGNGWPNPVVDRGRSTVVVDIRSDEGCAFCIEAADVADVVIEGFRPGVMERLGLGPDILCARNPALVYGRMTGWGQEGPLARTAGHDINYIALTGALAAMGKAGEAAVPPLNLVGDFGGGSMFLAFGIMAALWERQRSGKGQVIDAAIVDGVNSLMSMFSGLLPAQMISMDRDQNLLGGAAPFYRSYRCADGQEISVGALEPQFYAQLLDRIDAPSEWREGQNDSANWAERSVQMAEIFASKTATEWCAILEGTDACFAPVVELADVAKHPHMAERGAYVDVDGISHPAPAPRFSRTQGAIRPAQADGADLLKRWQAAGKA